ncbi:hypothetical protein TELCIR_13473 [Teladorsagia circumcincta]|uniref:Uncharacterized protein n=1 Tax=Teladorsagia circumcincta TaxID=45464 RepID=A0A2G9U3M8_TELCI|nr:hypothetical protein TELCIR_13473 [Teladorsagia circumcincta]
MRRRSRSAIPRQIRVGRILLYFCRLLPREVP